MTRLYESLDSDHQNTETVASNYDTVGSLCSLGVVEYVKWYNSMAMINLEGLQLPSMRGNLLGVTHGEHLRSPLCQ